MLYGSKTRAVFLDIDGVIAPYGRRNASVLDAECVRRVFCLAEVARVVLASSWRLEDAEDAIGLKMESLDRERRTYDGRPRAIWRWLCAHPEVTHWVSIDDDYIVRQIEKSLPGSSERALLQWQERFLRTDWSVYSPGHGLTEECCESALLLLNA